MANDKGTVGDKGGPGKMPIEDTEIYVDVEPGDNGSSGATEKIKQQVKKVVQEAIDGAAEHGRDKQLEAADAAVDAAAEQISHGAAEKVEVVVTGEAGDEEVYHEKTVVPKD